LCGSCEALLAEVGVGVGVAVRIGVAVLAALVVAVAATVGLATPVDAANVEAALAVELASAVGVAVEVGVGVVSADVDVGVVEVGGETVADGVFVATAVGSAWQAGGASATLPVSRSSTPGKDRKRVVTPTVPQQAPFPGRITTWTSKLNGKDHWVGLNVHDAPMGFTSHQGGRLAASPHEERLPGSHEKSSCKKPPTHGPSGGSIDTLHTNLSAGA
jgi:hypothetical protein